MKPRVTYRVSETDKVVSALEQGEVLMIPEDGGNLPCWYAIHTKPRQEDRADSNLRGWLVETFAPKSKERHHNQYTGKVSYLIKPLFPGYIFARFVLDAYLLHKIRFTRGVSSVVSTGNSPCSVDDEIIQIIHSRAGEDGLISLGEQLRQGDKVVVRDGPLRDFIGIFEGDYKDDERVSILLTTVSYQTRLVVPREAVRRVG